nr:12445_t:CDS:10 [Entrophospora candida]
MGYSQVTNNDQSLFFSTFPTQSEVRHHHQPQPIASTHHNHYNQYNQYENEDDDDGDYQSSTHNSSFLYGIPIDIFQEDQSTEAASIYKNAPPSTSIIISPNNNPLSEGLLPSCSIPPLLSANTRRKYKDPGCAVLFVLLFATMTLSGLVLLFTTSSTPLKEYAQNSIFFAIRDSTVWLLFFSRVFLLGRMVQDSTETTWILDSDAPLLITFYVLMYFWVTSVLNNVQRHEENFYYENSQLKLKNRDSTQDTTSLALNRATTTSLGTICFGSLVLSVIYTFQKIIEISNKYFSQYGCFYYFTVCLECISGIVDNFNNYVMVYVGISGESFLTSSRTATELFKKNLVDRLVDVMTLSFTKCILFINSLIITLIFGLVTFIYATHVLQSSYGYIPGILSTMISFYISRFYTCIMMNTVDAAFVCYAIDLDISKIHCKLAHGATTKWNKDSGVKL